MKANLSNNKPDFINIQEAFVASIKDPTTKTDRDFNPERLLLYRELVLKNIENILQVSFPVIHSIMHGADWNKMIEDFLVTHHSTSPMFHEIPQEFLNYLANERNVASDPDFLIELAHYEWAELYIGLLSDEIDMTEIDANGDLLQEKPASSPLAKLFQYEYPVHKIGKDFMPTESEKEKTYIIISRDRQHKVSFMAVNPIAARLMELMELKKYSGHELFAIIQNELQHPDPEIVIKGGLGLLKSFVDNDIVLGVWRVSSTKKARHV